MPAAPSIAAPPPPSAAPPERSAARLQNGDSLSSDEFLRRYQALPHVHHAELIEGRVYMPSPVSAEYHGEPHFSLNGWLFVYAAHTPGVFGGDNSTLRLDGDNVPQPDGYLRLLPERGGRSRLVDGYLHGPPELILEVAASSVSYDLHDKLHAYRRNGVLEYVVWRVLDADLDWFQLRDGEYERSAADHDGVYRSGVFPGLWLNREAVLSGDMARVLRTLQTGLAAAEHQAFVSR